MCGRYSLDYDLETVLKSYRIKMTDLAYEARSEIFPSSKNLVIDEKQTPKIMDWGMTFDFSKNLIINTRSESVMEKPMFKNLFEEKRCLIPAGHFYEWKTDSFSDKHKYRIGIEDEEIFSMAGIYRTFVKDGKTINQYSILTKRADFGMEKLHTRMPIILNKDSWEKYLYSKDQALFELEAIKPKFSFENISEKTVKEQLSLF